MWTEDTSEAVNALFDSYQQIVITDKFEAEEYHRNARAEKQRGYVKRYYAKNVVDRREERRQRRERDMKDPVKAERLRAKNREYVRKHRELRKAAL